MVILLAFPSIVVAARPDHNSLQIVLLTHGIVCHVLFLYSICF